MSLSKSLINPRTQGNFLIYFHKILPLIISPLMLITCLLFLGLFIKRTRLIFSGIILLILCSLPLTGHLIWLSLEAAHPPKHKSEINNYNAVVVLSGMLTTNKIDTVNFIEWSDPDRFFAGLEILETEKVEKIIFTRGKLPWSGSIPEGEILKRKAIEFGVPAEKIFLTRVVSNTAEEAEAVGELLRLSNTNEVIIVTSSFHMPRALLLFQQQGINVEPFPVDFRATGHRIDWTYFFPSASGFYKTSKGIREYIGRIYYLFKL